MDDLISRAALLDEFHSLCGPQTGDGWDNMGVRNLIMRQKAVDAIPVAYLMKYAQLPTEFAIAAWRKQDKDDQEKQIKRLDKPMSLDDALNLVNEVFPLGQKEKEANGA